MERGSYEAMEWLKLFRFKKNYPFFLQKGYNLKIVKQITETCSDEMISIMNKYIHKYHKLEDALSIAIGEIQIYLIAQEDAKRKFIANKAKEEEVRLKDLNKLLNEAEKPKYTPEQERLRNAEYSGKVPLNIILQQPVLDSGYDRFNRKSGLTWKIYDKIYGYYYVVVDSPIRGSNVAYRRHRDLHWKGNSRPADFERFPNSFLSPKEHERDGAGDCVYGSAYSLLKKVYDDDRTYLAQLKYDNKRKKEESVRQQEVIIPEIVVPEFTFPEVDKIKEMTEEHKRDRKNPFTDSGDIF